MTGKRIEGDLLELALTGAFDVIVHGCNCFHRMGAGIAKPIAARFPEALAADKATPYGDKAKLGTISTAMIRRGDVSFAIANAYTQFRYGRHGRHVDYAAIESCFREVAARFPDAHVGYPRIGAGLAGGAWDQIEPSVHSALAGHRHTLVVLPASSAASE